MHTFPPSPFVSPASSFIILSSSAPLVLFCIISAVIPFSVSDIINLWQTGLSTCFRMQLSCWCFGYLFMEVSELGSFAFGRGRSHCCYGVSVGVSISIFLLCFHTVGSLWGCYLHCYCFSIGICFCYGFIPRKDFDLDLIVVGVLVSVIIFHLLWVYFTFIILISW